MLFCVACFFLCSALPSLFLRVTSQLQNRINGVKITKKRHNDNALRSSLSSKHDCCFRSDVIQRQSFVTLNRRRIGPYAAFTRRDTCSLDTSCIHCIHLYRLSPSTYPVSATKLSLRRQSLCPLVSNCIRIQVARPGYLYPAGYMYLM